MFFYSKLPLNDLEALKKHDFQKVFNFVNAVHFWRNHRGVDRSNQINIKHRSSNNDK